jgi:hypothetical protein
MSENCDGGGRNLLLHAGVIFILGIVLGMEKLVKLKRSRKEGKRLKSRWWWRRKWIVEREES